MAVRAPETSIIDGIHKEHFQPQRHSKVPRRLGNLSSLWWRRMGGTIGNLSVEGAAGVFRFFTDSLAEWGSEELTRLVP